MENRKTEIDAQYVFMGREWKCGGARDPIHAQQAGHGLDRQSSARSPLLPIFKRFIANHSTEHPNEPNQTAILTARFQIGKKPNAAKLGCKIPLLSALYRKQPQP